MSAHFKTGMQSTPPMTLEEVRERATHAKGMGATRFCIGTAWRGPKDGSQFDRILEWYEL